MSALPNLIVIGVTSCGTSALHYYLDLHPQIAMSHPKELDFFIDDVEVEGQVSVSSPRELALVRDAPCNWSRGLDWYASHFSPSYPVRGESSPRYTTPWLPGVAERMASIVPDARLMLLVRDPIERMLSHYVMLRADGREWREVSEAFASPGNLYVARSQYFRQLQPFLERFPAGRILILTHEGLLRRRAQTLRTAYRFVGVDERFNSPKFERKRHRTGGQGRRYRVASRLLSLPGARLAYRLPEEVKWRMERAVTRRQPKEPERPNIDHLRIRLHEQLAGDVERFRCFTGQDFAEWSV